MALPIFLRPLLLISHYYRVLTQTFTGWLAESSNQMFGPLEQMIVAVVITGLAMNPNLLPQFHPQVPVAMPFQHVPAAPPRDPAPVLPPQTGQNDTSPTSNHTSVETALVHTGHTWLGTLFNCIPENLKPNPIVLSLIILLISVLIHLLPQHLLRRMRHSWDIFWPPWQDRDSRTSSSRSADTDSTTARSSSVRSHPTDASATARSVDGNRAEAKAGPSASDLIDEEKAKQKAMLAYEAKKAAAKKAAEDRDPKKAADNPGTSLALEPKARTVSPVIIAKDPAGTEQKTRSEQARDVKDPSASPRDGNDQKGSSTPADDPLMAGDYRPLRSALKKSTQKPRQSKNIHHNHFMTMRGNRACLVPFPHGLHPPPDQPRHSLWWKNIPKNADHMMAPPPVPKEVKDVLEGEDPEDLEAKPKVETVSDKVGMTKEGDTDKEKLKEREKEKEKAKMKAELEAKEKAKARQAKDSAGTATASVSIEPPSRPDLSVDLQVQKATWASQAMLCLMLFYIQEQLGLVLLAFFVCQQLNNNAARQSGELSKLQQPVATATAKAAAPPPSSREAAVRIPNDQDMPLELKEKLARAKAVKEARAKQEANATEADDLRAGNTRPDKGKGREGTPGTVPSSKKSTSPTSTKGNESAPRALTPEERAAYRARSAKASSSSSSKPSSDKVSAGADEPMTKEKWAKMSDEEKKRFLSDREKRKQAQSAKDTSQPQPAQNSERDRDATQKASTTMPEANEPMTKEKWAKMSDGERKRYLSDREKRKQTQSTKEDSQSRPAEQTDKGEQLSQRDKWEKMSDEDKKRYLAEKERRRDAEKARPRMREEEAAARAEKWDKMTDEEKKRYLYERQKRDNARKAHLKAEEGSGLSADEKEKL